jgi:hypothetical protein
LTLLRLLQVARMGHVLHLRTDAHLVEILADGALRNTDRPCWASQIDTPVWRPFV